jgi:hypothetical protein
MTFAVVRWLAESFLAALFVLEHVRLAWGAGRWWAWMIPGAPIALALRRGARWGPALSVAVALAWGALRATR